MICGNRRSSYPEHYWSCAGGRSAVSAIGRQKGDLIKSRLTRWRSTEKKLDTVSESRRKKRSPGVSIRVSLVVENEQVDA